MASGERHAQRRRSFATGDPFPSNPRARLSCSSSALSPRGTPDPCARWAPRWGQNATRATRAIDIRFSRTYVSLSDFGGNQIALESFGTVFDPDQLLDELATRVRRLLRAHTAGGHCEGIGVVMPGMVDRRSGRVLNAPQLGWRDVQVESGLVERTGLPVHIENSGAACALAHMWLGPGERGGGGGSRIRDFVYVTVSG